MTRAIPLFCAIESCDRNAVARGWCDMHYSRWKAHGDPNVMLGHGKGHGSPRKSPEPCLTPDCNRQGRSRGYCDRHYKRLMKYGDAEAPRLNWKGELPGAQCSAGECQESAKARGYCELHYQRWQRHGDPTVLLQNGPGSGEGYLDPTDGYRKRYVPGRGRVKEHRLVMEGLLGRRLLREETVHHVNGERADNRPENLELWSSSHPRGQRVADKVEWARAILALYATEET